MSEVAAGTCTTPTKVAKLHFLSPKGLAGVATSYGRRFDLRMGFALQADVGASKFILVRVDGEHQGLLGRPEQDHRHVVHP